MKKSPVQRSVVIISFRFDPGLLGDVAHYGVLSFYPLHQFLWILIGDRESRFLQLGYARWVLDRFREGRDQFSGHVAGQVGRPKNSKPRVQVYLGKTQLGKGWKLGEFFNRAGNGKNAERAGSHMARHDGPDLRGAVDVAAQQRRDVGGGSRFIGNMVDLRTGGDFQKLQVEMARAAHARGAAAYLAGVLFGVAHELVEGFPGRIGIHRDQSGGDPHVGERSKILERVIGEIRGNGRRVGKRGPVERAEGVAVRFGFGDEVGTDHADRAGLVLKEDVGLKLLAQRLAGDPAASILYRAGAQ